MGLHSLIIIICQYSTTHIFSNKLILVLAVPLFMHVAAHFFMTNIFNRFFLFFLFTVSVNHSFLLKSTVSPLFLSFCLFLSSLSLACCFLHSVPLFEPKPLAFLTQKFFCVTIKLMYFSEPYVPCDKYKNNSG